MLLGLGYSNLTSIDLASGETVTSGGALFVLFLGWLVALAGAFSILVGVIAKGVQIGNRAS